MTDLLCKKSEEADLNSKSTRVQFVLRSNAKWRHILLDCSPMETVSAIKKRLSDVVGADPALLRLVFSGQSLVDGMRLSALELGPTTSLTLLLGNPYKRPSGACHIERDVMEEEGWVKLTADQLETNAVNFSDESAFSAFFVFCKHCVLLARAKLRAYCRACESSAIIFLNEPQHWDDVKENNSIRVFCGRCERERGVLFRFKCVHCDESASPLQHICRNVSLPPCECVICGTDSFPLGVRLRDCTHFCCVQCFVAYAEELLSRMGLKWHPKVGYTVGCPVYGCAAVVSDVHTLYLLGKHSYQHYQQLAAQLFFAAQVEERQHCPWPNCGAAFFVEETEQKSAKQTATEVVLCPECCRMFCRRCNSTNSVGTSTTCKCALLQRIPADAESASLIRRTTKNCPRCAAPTERNGGCAHIRCTQCQSEWCFICLKLWSDDCQWDHWFE